MATNHTRWAEQKQRLQTRWPALTEEDLDSTQGDREALLGLLQGRLGYAAANAESDLDQILAGEIVVPRDVADEDSHTGTSGPIGGLNASYEQSSSRREPVERTASWEAPAQGRTASSEIGSAGDQERPRPQYSFGDDSPRGRPTRPGWQVPAIAGAMLSAGCAAWFLMRRRRARQKRLHIEVPIPSWPPHADRVREVAQHAFDAGRANSADLVKNAAGRIGPRLEDTAERMQEMAVEKAAVGMEEAASYLRAHEAAEIRNDVAGYFKGHPARAALVAAAVGLFVGRTLR